MSDILWHTPGAFFIPPFIPCFLFLFFSFFSFSTLFFDSAGFHFQRVLEGCQACREVNGMWLCMILFPHDSGVGRVYRPLPPIVGGVDPAEMVRVLTGLVDDGFCTIVV